MTTKSKSEFTTLNAKKELEIDNALKQFSDISILYSIAIIKEQIDLVLKLLDDCYIPKTVTIKHRRSTLEHNLSLSDRVKILVEKYTKSIKERSDLIELLSWDELDDIQTIYNDIKSKRNIK